MSVSILSNIQSLISQRFLLRATDSLAASSERLASGQRINHASDDAAGLAIATSLQNDSRVFGQSIRNINDGISALAIADGATSNLSSILTRLKELAIQSASGSLGTLQRRSINQEAQAIRTEFNRIISTTKFNGISLIDQRTGTIRLEGGFTSDLAALFLNSSNLNAGKWGDGTFSSGTSYAFFTSGIHATVDSTNADFNEDGIQDLALVRSGGDGVAILFGNGDGTFKAPLSYANSNTTSIASGDLNGDGRADVVVGGTTGISVFLSNGDGSLAQSVSFSVSGAAALDSLDLRDLNGDGFLDVTSSDSAGNAVFTLLGNSNGSFRAAQSFAATSAKSGAFGDFNGDGKIDLAVAQGGSTAMRVLIGNGDGTFLAAVSYDASNASAIGIASGDFNGDGKLDLVVNDFGIGQYNIMFGNGDGTFNARTSFSLGGGVGGATMATSDFNGDGIVDFVVANTGANQILLGNGNGTFRIGANLVGGGNVNIADLDNDGVMDIFSASSTAIRGGVNVSIGNGNRVSFLNTIDLSNRAGAYAALNMLESSHSNLLIGIGKIGAEQSRLQTALNNLNTSRDNFLGAESRISDIDVASEAAQYARSQILQQVSASVLSQANLQPQLALTLLKNI